MTTIAHMRNIAEKVRKTTERLRGKEYVTSEDLKHIIDELDYLKEDVNTSIDLKWEHICKAVKVEYIQRLVEVLTRAIKRKMESWKTTTRNRPRQNIRGSMK